MVASLSFPAAHVINGMEWQQFLDFLVPLYVRKTSDETRNSDTTVSNDDDLYLYVKANAIYNVRALLIVSGDTAGDMRLQWSGPSGAAFTWTLAGSNILMSSQFDLRDWGGYDISTQPGPGTIGAGSATLYRPHGLLRTGTVGGVFRLTWAQFSSSATFTTVRAASFMIAHRIS